MKVLDTKLEEIVRAKALGSIFRSKSKFAREGEKCSAFFLSLEKKHYLEKNMKSVYKSDGTLTYCQKEILDTQTDFYKDLYKADPKIKFHLKPELNKRVLNDDEKYAVEKPLTLDEFFDAMMTLKPNKIPGLDGITIKFYRKFWKHLSPMLMDMYSHSYDVGMLPASI